MYDGITLGVGRLSITIVAITHLYLALTGECLGFISFGRTARILCHVNTAAASFTCAYLFTLKSRMVMCIAFITTFLHCGVYVFLLISGDEFRMIERTVLLLWLPAVLCLALDSDFCPDEERL